MADPVAQVVQERQEDPRVAMADLVVLAGLEHQECQADNSNDFSLFDDTSFAFYCLVQVTQERGRINDERNRASSYPNARPPSRRPVTRELEVTTTM